MSKVKCLFGKHDLYHDTNTPDYRCKSCSLLINVYDGSNQLSDFAIDNGESIYKTPYLYHVDVVDCIMACNVTLTEEEVLALYKWTEEYWNEWREKNLDPTPLI